jgi:hypothetical protein
MAWAILVLVVVLIVISLMRFNLTALHQPGPAETRLANLSKRYLIYRASRHGIPPRPQDTKASIERGGSHYGLDCGMPCRRWPGTTIAGAVDVPTGIRSHEQSGSELLRPGAVLDLPEWNPLHRNAGWWLRRDPGPRLGSRELCAEFAG